MGIGNKILMGIGNKILMGRGLTDHRTMGYNIFI